MTLADFKRRLQACNSELHIKTYGASKAGVFRGTQYICRVEPGDIMPYNVYTNEYGQNDGYMTDFNPKGYYKYRLLVKRGRAEVARVLYTQRLVTLSQVSQLSM